MTNQQNMNSTSHGQAPAQRQVSRTAITALLGVALMYALFAFVLWDFDPHTWGFGGRYFFAIFATVAACASAAILKGKP